MIALLRRSFFEPLHGVFFGATKHHYWKKIEKRQYLPLEELKKIQHHRLLDLIQFVWDKNPFYRERLQSAGLTLQSINNIDDLLSIPILSKDEIRKNMEKMISEGYDKHTLLQFKTGGSTGKPLELYLTEECSEQRNACARRNDCWTGWQPGEPIGACWGNPHLPITIKEKIKHWLLQPTIFLDTMAVDDKSVYRFAEEWRKTKPTLLFGHAHSIFVLACFVEELGIDCINPTGILSTSMMLMPHERNKIEKVFGIKVTDRYGCEEVSLIASQCEKHMGMHINMEHLVVELLGKDDKPVLPGESGRIVVTDLMNYAMPFIRYEVGDIGIFEDDICSCGRHLPLLKSIVGRTADFLVKKNGVKVAGVSLIENTLTKYPGIQQMQLVQKNMDSLYIRVVPDDDFSVQTKKLLLNYFEEIFGDISINIEELDEILPESNGKYRFSICEIN